MNSASIRCYASGAVVATVCLLTGAVFLGCAQEASPSKTVAPATVASPPETSPVAAEVQLAAAEQPADAEQTALAAVEAAKDAEETITVGACDGGEDIEVPKDLTGQALADSLMDQWKRDHPEANWVEQQKERHALKSPADNSDLLKSGQGADHTYGNYTERDILTWARETEKFVAEGSRIFHDADALGSTLAVSCDMCHPHASNTHPETYPKYQVQLGRVALLRDMINWCVENPVRAEKLDPDGPVMRALEAYIHSERQGVPMNFGKH